MERFAPILSTFVPRTPAGRVLAVLAAATITLLLVIGISSIVSATGSSSSLPGQGTGVTGVEVGQVQLTDGLSGSDRQTAQEIERILGL